MGVPAFELFIARRYLRAKRKQAAVSLITWISIIGVAAGVMALLVALAINNGFRNTLQRSLLGATAHVTVLERVPAEGIVNWRALVAQYRQLPQVTAAYPTLYANVFLSSPTLSSGAIVKGIPADQPNAVPDALRTLKSGSLAQLESKDGLPGIVMGTRLAQATGMMLQSVVTVISPQGELTPFGPRPSYYRFRVVGLFETGVYELDANWAYVSLRSAQTILSVQDVVNAIELRLDDVQQAPAVAQQVERSSGPTLAATNWMEQNRPLMNALRMEKVVTVITIGLIQLVAALNILITLTMMVMEKQKDIAILASMGARREQIRRIFMLQGLLIGSVGVALGLVAGYTLCYLAERYRWVQLDESIYALSYVPFEPRGVDGIWIAAMALGVSLLATLHPARGAAQIAPVEVLRYE